MTEHYDHAVPPSDGIPGRDRGGSPPSVQLVVVMSMQHGAGPTEAYNRINININMGQDKY